MMEMDEGGLQVCVLRLDENEMKKHRLAKKWKPFKMVNLFIDRPVYDLFYS